MNSRPTSDVLRAWHDDLLRELETDPRFREWKAVHELLELSQSNSSEPIAGSLLSERARRVREKEKAIHLQKQNITELKKKCLQSSAEIYLSTGNEAMKASSLVEMLAETGVVSRQGRYWKTANTGKLHQWLKSDKQRFIQVDATNKLWALKPEYYDTLKAKLN